MISSQGDLTLYIIYHIIYDHDHRGEGSLIYMECTKLCCETFSSSFGDSQSALQSSVSSWTQEHGQTFHLIRNKIFTKLQTLQDSNNIFYDIIPLIVPVQ